MGSGQLYIPDRDRNPSQCAARTAYAFEERLNRQDLKEQAWFRHLMDSVGTTASHSWLKKLQG